MMAAHYWIKLYQDVLRDPKMGRLPDSAWRRCIELFLLAGEQDARDGILPDLDDIAWQLRITREQLDCDLEILAAADIITLENGQAFVTNFEKRQSADGSTERWRQWRDRQRNKNEKQTPPQPESNGGKRKSNEKLVDKETETDRETDRETRKPPQDPARPESPPPQPEPAEDCGSGGCSGDFAAVVKAYENNIGGLTEMVSELIGDAVDTYPVDWIIDAIGIAVKNNSLKWGYVEGVLKNWQAHGRGYSPKTNGRNGHHPINQTMDEILSTAFD